MRITEHRLQHLIAMGFIVKVILTVWNNTHETYHDIEILGKRKGA